MSIEQYKITPGEEPNPVLHAARGYLDAAEAVFKVESAKRGFLDFPSWFVVHHLSVIASELFVKSFLASVSHDAVMDESGPADERYEAAFRGHGIALGKLDEVNREGLKPHLEPHLLGLLTSVPDNARASVEVARGRYPYEDEEGKLRFPVGEDGKALALDWLHLACALSRYKG